MFSRKVVLKNQYKNTDFGARVSPNSFNEGLSRAQQNRINSDTSCK